MTALQTDIQLKVTITLRLPQVSATYPPTNSASIVTAVPNATRMSMSDAPGAAKYSVWYGLAIAVPIDHRDEVEVSTQALRGRLRKPLALCSQSVLMVILPACYRRPVSGY